MLFPLLIKGETYYEIRLPRWLRFRTDGPVEKVLFYAVLTPAAFVLIPGVWPVLWPLLLELAHHAPALG